MGCHTWFYRKIERTQEEAKQSCLQGLKKSINLGWKMYKNPTSYYGIDWGVTKKEQFKYFIFLNRQIRMISNNLCQRAVWNPQNNSDLTEYADSKGLFIGDTNFHDWFRIGNYPDDKLFSLEETLEYIELKGDEITFGNFTLKSPKEQDYQKREWVEVNREESKQKCIKKLKGFWNKYPDGMILFG